MCNNDIYSLLNIVHTYYPLHDFDAFRCFTVGLVCCIHIILYLLLMYFHVLQYTYLIARILSFTCRYSLQNIVHTYRLLPTVDVLLCFTVCID